MPLTTPALSNIALSNASASNALSGGQIPQLATGRESEFIYGDIRQPSLDLSGDVPPTEANLQGRMSPNKSLPGNKSEPNIQAIQTPNRPLKGS